MQSDHQQALHSHVLLATALMLLALAGPALAQQPALQDHEVLRQLAERHALALAQQQAPHASRVQVQAARLDPRLRLVDCPVLPEVDASTGQRLGNSISVAIRCPEHPSWAIYVPVRIQQFGQVLVLANARARGELLSSADLRLEERDLAQLNGAYLSQLDAATDMVLRRAVRPGTVLSASMLERPKLVLRGQRVQVIAGMGALAVASEGEALSDAAAGERVRVRNLSSRQVLEGVVDPQGRVRAGS